MKRQDVDLIDRCVDFSLRIMDLYRDLSRDSAGRVIGHQLLRCGTSVGANLEEGQGAESRADFIHKIKLCYKEARESRYWLTLIERDKALCCDKVSKLKDESLQLVKIFGKIVSTAKKNNKK